MTKKKEVITMEPTGMKCRVGSAPCIQILTPQSGWMDQVPEIHKPSKVTQELTTHILSIY